MRNTVFVQTTVYINQNVTKSVQYITLSYGRPRTKTEVMTEVVNIFSIPVYSCDNLTHCSLGGLLTLGTKETPFFCNQP